MRDPDRLYYWPILQGRGEYVRLVLEEAGAAYVDVARLPADEGGGFESLLAFMRGGDPASHRTRHRFWSMVIWSWRSPLPSARTSESGTGWPPKTPGPGNRRSSFSSRLAM